MALRSRSTPALRCYDDDAVAAAPSVDGCRGIFQHADGRDVMGVDGDLSEQAGRERYAIHDV